MLTPPPPPPNNNNLILELKLLTSTLQIHYKIFDLNLFCQLKHVYYEV